MSVSMNEARRTLYPLVKSVEDDLVPVEIDTQDGEGVVIVPRSEWRALQETAYLLASPANAAQLRNALADVRAGKALIPDEDVRG